MEAELQRHAGRLGLSVNTRSWCRAAAAPPAPDAPAALVIGYGTPPEHAFEEALDALCTLVTL
ncbi:hypothetical protein [Kitasatospora sp. NPDC085879]|uniref:hypothetical protein n=1 Tax=Kitasatospora sp. NPDC085879 TaxID=3154769 RepID=UPI000BB13A08|nr:hypothetical protein [Streptomyces sp. TLI_235]